MPGTTLGSVHYFSPEQARGEMVTAASDVYSAGLVLFEMLTGRRAWTGDSAGAVAVARLAGDPPAPSSICPRVPPILDIAVRRALARAPADRPTRRRNGRAARPLHRRPGRRRRTDRRRSRSRRQSQPCRPPPPPVAGRRGPRSCRRRGPRARRWTWHIVAEGRGRRDRTAPGRGAGSPPSWACWCCSPAACCCSCSVGGGPAATSSRQWPVIEVPSFIGLPLSRRRRNAQQQGSC